MAVNAKNKELKNRNANFASKVRGLKNGIVGVEEYGRFELGKIKKD